MNPEPDERSELDWLAFRYAAGELSATDAADVERRMADDQELREAVSRAVALGLTLTSARPATIEPAVQLRPGDHLLQWHRQNRLAWAGLGLAASVVLVLFGYRVWHSDKPVPAVNQVAQSNVSASAMTAISTGASPETAAKWLELRAIQDSARQLERRFSEWEHDEPNEFEGSDGPAVPRWLIGLAMTSAEKGKHD